MKIFSIPQTIDVICFDIDSTLYTHPGYAAHQYDVLYDALSRHLRQNDDGLREQLREQIEAWRIEQAGGTEGNKPSLGTAFTHFGADISLSIRWRSEYIRPEDYLQPDARLNETLSSLSSICGRRSIENHLWQPGDPESGSRESLGGAVVFAAVTNNPVDIARRTLHALGVERHFSRIVGLDTAGRSKPESPHYDLALGSSDPCNALAVGDRYHVDIQPALERKMGAVLVDGVEDVYELPRIIRASQQNQ